jgi:hypothetical protein
MNKSIIGTLVALGSFMVPVDSTADVKVYHGGICVEADASVGIGPVPALDVTSNPSDGALNTSSSAQPWFCPLVRDNSLSTADITQWAIDYGSGSMATQRIG